jgi:hypothetical protein
MENEDQSRRRRAELEAWYGRTTEEIERAKRAAQEAGREAWNRSTRTGENLVARTQSELEALGRSELAKQAEAREHDRRLARTVSDPKAWREIGMHVDAGVRGAAEEATFGSINTAAAVVDALFDRGNSRDFAKRYQKNLAREDSRDEYDKKHRRAARELGKLGGAFLTYKAAATPVMQALDRLPPYQKGLVGEDLSRIKTVLLGDWPLKGQRRVNLSEGFTRVDVPTARGLLREAKFGPSADLSHRQRQAVKELAPKYRVDWWLKEHVGRPVGAAAAATGWLAADPPKGR